MVEHTSVPHLVSDLEARFMDLETRFHEAYWDSQVKVTPETEARRAEIELELRRLKGDPASYQAISNIAEDDVHDPVMARQVNVLHRSLTGNQMDDAHRVALVNLGSAVESEFAAFRPTVDGRRFTDNEIHEILDTSDDLSRREDVWRASKEVGQAVAERVRDLVRTRNEVALSLGFADYYRMSLELQELSEEWLFEKLDDLEELTRAPFAAWKEGVDAELKRRFNASTVMPWHYADPFFQEAPREGSVDLDPFLRPIDPAEVSVKTFEGWGIDIRPVIDKSDIFPRDLKSQHAFCLDVDRTGRNVRILANVVPGERWTTVMLHESGHAAYDISFNKRMPYLLRRPTHIFVTEAIAIMCGRFARDPAWLRDIAGIPSSDVAQLGDSLARANAAESLQFARWGLVMAHFERDLYADPEGDLDERWWDHVERLQMIDRPDDVPVGGWASKIHLAVAPVYYHNYLLGEMLASQLSHTMMKVCGGVIGSKSAGEFLTERVFRSGAFMRWDALIEEATGTGLSATAFGADVGLG
jgi:peptidyl-dipeptidase A